MHICLKKSLPHELRYFKCLSDQKGIVQENFFSKTAHNNWFSSLSNNNVEVAYIKP